MPAASGTRAATSVTVYAFCTMSYIVCFELSANTSAAAVKATRITRSASRKRRSLMFGKNGRMMFSVQSEVGAMIAPLAVERIAESSAPKNSTLIASGVCSRMKLGRMRCISRASSAESSLPSAGSTSSAAQTM